MTDVLDRRSSVELDEIEGVTPSSPPGGVDVSVFGRAALASLLVGAAVIHLVMVPSHLDEWTAEGAAFLVAGWMQILLAVVIARRATRAVLAIGIALNLAFVGAWAWTRIWGSPWGPHVGIAESVGFVDAVCAGLEIAFVIGAFVFLLRPRLGGRRAWTAVIIPIAVLGMTTAAIASPSARNHAHGGGEGAAHDHGDAASAGEHGRDGAMAADHEHGDDHAQRDDNGLGMLVNGHHGEMTIKPVDALTQAKLDGQLAVTREVAATYPTLADAMAGGYRRQGPYSPGLGVHYGRYNNMNPDGVMDRNDLLNPMTILYDGT
jgi:hypothetical protein